ncbi:MAG: AIR synthase-related protein, partial [Arenimonas sp.]|jgi:thiamine-monophosphate kinase
MALRRDGAGFNDDIWVTGTLGDAGGALSQWRGKGLMSAKLRYRLDRPTPRIAAGIALRELANAGIDISDGLVVDLGHVLRRSGVGAELDLGRLPCSRTLADHFSNEAERWRLQLGAGDDYELCFTAAPANALAIEQAMAACDTAATVIGRITREPGLRLRTPEGESFEPGNGGYQHFAGPAD